MGLVEEEIVLAKKSNKKNNENGLLSVERLETRVDNTDLELIEDDKKKKKREKREKKLKRKEASVEEQERDVEIGGEMKNESLDFMKDVKESDCEVELEVTTDKKKKKRKKEKDVGSKERELENNQEEINFVVAEGLKGNTTNGEKKGTKERKDEIGVGACSRSFNNGNPEGGFMGNKNSHSSKDENESDQAIVLQVNKDKKQKEKKYKSKEGEIESNEHEENITKKKNKDPVGRDVVSHLMDNINIHPIRDKKRKRIANDNATEEKPRDDGGSSTDMGCLKKRKKEKKCKDDIQDFSRQTLAMPTDIEIATCYDSQDNNIKNSSSPVGKKKRDRGKSPLHMEMEKHQKKTKKTAEFANDFEKNGVKEGQDKTKNKDVSADCSGNLKLKKPSKRVKFSGKIEVFPIADIGDAGKESQKGGLVRGKRFSQEEDTILKNAVFNYIKEHNLGDDGIKKVLHCKSDREVKNCWKEISAIMPWRTVNSIYNRVHILFERGEKREWTAEEKELLKEFHEKHGADWRTFADEYNKSRIHVKDTWRRICLPNKKTGSWSQDEYQKFFDLVNMDLRMKAFEEKKSKHGMLRDNIAWEAISSKLSTRTNSDCCYKWYKQLESPLVREGKWVSSDDFRLLNELVTRDYISEEEVDWENLLDHRPGDICRKRWHQMVNHLGEHGIKTFADKVEVLTKRYSLDVLEARQIYEDKTPVT